MRINVEKHHINCSEQERKNRSFRQISPAMCSWCPIALALRFHGFKEVDVFPTYIRIEGYKGIFIPTDEMKQFIMDFDLGNKVKPFQFEFNSMQRVIGDKDVNP